MQGIIIIPARYDSSRFPGKPLSLILGIPMIVRVLKQCEKVEGVASVVVATDDRRIADAVDAAGGEAVMTSPDCLSGTDRVAEAAAGTDADWIINVQGDEPLIPPENIARVLNKLREGAPMATLDYPISEETASDPSIVKVVKDAEGRALYFSRSPIPYFRGKGEHFKHIGIYGYQSETLKKFISLPPSPLEITEGLEQLRALYHGIPIVVERAFADTLAVDEPHHIGEVEAVIRKVEGAIK